MTFWRQTNYIRVVAFREKYYEFVQIIEVNLIKGNILPSIFKYITVFALCHYKRQLITSLRHQFYFSFSKEARIPSWNMKSVAAAARSLRKRPFRVSIEGNIGSGKSTCIKFFDKFDNVETHAVSRF